MTDSTDLAPTIEPALVQWQGVKSDAFEDSPLSMAYWNVRHELRQRSDTAKKSSKHHHCVALWAAWEGHKGHVEELNDKVTLLERVGLPKTQKGLADLLGINVRTLRNYASTYKDLANLARQESLDRILSQYDALALHSLGMMASMASPKTAPDRRLFMDVRGFTNRNKGQKEMGSKDNPVHLVGMSLAQWQAEQARRRAELDAKTAETIDVFEGDDETA